MAKGAAFFVLVLALAFVFLMDSAYSDDSAYEAGSKIKETAHDLKHKTEDFFKGIFGRLAKIHHHHDHDHTHGHAHAHDHSHAHAHAHTHAHGPAAAVPVSAPEETPKAAKAEAPSPV
ncbi:urease accessory protein UreG-like isoform X3 [Macadamia integrifolia]|uniref:urease accessory protein UreG-like isoform X3 n=1 Tax=Macadamia integrifolia TaxID=60698 RepID=UPI001C4E91DE|nr:urease accessory protein UreG-like isoform X3 [Macadamia integrifolia]